MELPRPKEATGLPFRVSHKHKEGELRYFPWNCIASGLGQYYTHRQGVPLSIPASGQPIALANGDANRINRPAWPLAKLEELRLLMRRDAIAADQLYA